MVALNNATRAAPYFEIASDLSLQYIFFSVKLHASYSKFSLFNDKIFGKRQIYINKKGLLWPEKNVEIPPLAQGFGPWDFRKNFEFFEELEFFFKNLFLSKFRYGKEDKIFKVNIPNSNVVLA